MTFAIAKFRESGRPGVWWITDFTMGQVEGRLSALSIEVESLRRRVVFLEEQNGMLSCRARVLEERCSAYERDRVSKKISGL